MNLQNRVEQYLESSVCHSNGLSAFAPLCMALRTVYHSAYCAAEQDFKANGGTGFFRSM